MMQPDYGQIDLSQWIKVGEGGNGSTYGKPIFPDDELSSPLFFE